MNVASLFVTLGLDVDEKTFAEGSAAIDKIAAKAQAAMAGVRANAQHFDQVVLDTSRAARGVAKEATVTWDGWQKGAKRGIDWTKAWNTSARAATGTLRVLKGAAIAVFGGGLLIKSIASLGDEYNAAAGRVRQLTDDTEQQKRINDQLFASAQRTGSAFADVTSLYQQVGKAAKDSGRSLEQGVAIVETINKAVKAGGTSSQGASQAIQQLTQAIGSGTLRAEEFNSVIEQAPFLLDVIAKDLGKTRGEMRKLAESGTITSKVILRALERQVGAVDEAYGKRIPLVSESFARMRNEISKALGEVLQRKDVMAGLQNLLKGATVAVVGLIKGLAAFGSFFAEHSTLAMALLSALTAAFVVFGIKAGIAWVMALGPIGLFIAALAAVVVLWDDIVKNFKRSGRAIRDLFKAIGGVFRSIGNTLKSAFAAAVNWLIQKINWALGKVNWILRKLNKIPGIEIGTFDMIDEIGQSSKKTAAMTPTRSPSTMGGSTYNVTGTTTIQVNAPNANAEEVASATDLKLRGFWDRQMRNAGSIA